MSEATRRRFFLGLLLALVFQNKRMRFKNGYRIMMILPYAFPAFLSALIWAGMMDKSFGFINDNITTGFQPDLAIHGSRNL